MLETFADTQSRSSEVLQTFGSRDQRLKAVFSLPHGYLYHWETKCQSSQSGRLFIANSTQFPWLESAVCGIADSLIGCNDIQNSRLSLAFCNGRDTYK